LGVANGAALLDATGRLPSPELPSSAVISSSPNTFTAAQAISPATSGPPLVLTGNDQASDILRVANAGGQQLVLNATGGTGVTQAGQIIFYAANAPTGGGNPAGRGWYLAVDTAAAIPQRDIVLGKFTSAGGAADADGMYISNGGANPASIGFGFPQPQDTGTDHRVKIKSGSITQGGLQIAQFLGQTSNLFTATSSGGVDHLWLAPASANNWNLVMIGDNTVAVPVFTLQSLGSQGSTTTTQIMSNGNFSTGGSFAAPGNWSQVRSDGQQGLADLQASGNGHLRFTAAATSDATCAVLTVNHAPLNLGTNSTVRTIITRDGSLVQGTAALATTATDGFLYIPTCAGAPTGVPTAQTGTVPIVFDTTDKRLYVYESAAWHYFAETA
jgi:hypothetical protein